MQNTDWTKFKPLQVRFNSFEDTLIQDYLPIIGNVMPSRTIQMFDAAAIAASQLAYSGDGTMTIDYMAAYHSDSCLKIALIDGDTGYLTITPKAALDLTCLSKKTNEYAKIKRTGISTDAEKRTRFVLNAAVKHMTVDNENMIQIYPTFYSGTAYADFNASPSEYGPDYGGKNWWEKRQTDILNPAASPLFHNGFTSDSWTAIDKIVLKIVCTDIAAETVYLYLQDIYMALPFYYISIPLAYYPQIDDSNTIFVSQLWGNDANSGARASPVATIEQAISITTGSTPYICIVDSQVYKPIALDGSYVGIKQTLARETTIIADYLETPVISAAPGLLDEVRVGARAYYRNDFYQFYGTGNTYAVKQDGSGPGGYTTITAAYGAASDGDCIEIQDNGVYDEIAKLTIGKQVIIQAAAGYMPTWSHTANDQILKTTKEGVRIQGIIFKGTYQDTSNAIEITKEPFIKDCTFMNFGDNSTPGFNIIHDMEATQGKTIHNCLFVDNAECVVCIASESGASGGTKHIINCKALMRGATGDNVFIGAGKAKSGTDLKVIGIGNECLSSLGNSLGYFVKVDDATHTANVTTFMGYMNDTNMLSDFARTDGSLLVAPYMKLNYIHDNAAATGLPALNVSINETAYIDGNYFKNLYFGSEFGVGIAKYLRNNIFDNCGYRGVIDFSAPTNTIDNIFVNCGRAYISAYSSGGNVSNFILVNNVIGIDGQNGDPGNAINVINSIRYNSPNATEPGSGTVQDVANILNDDPNFLDNFSWTGQSNIELDPSIFTAGWGAMAFINPAGAKLNFMFMELSGYMTLPTIATDNVNIDLKYCTLDGAQCGLNESVHNCTQQGVQYTSNGIGMRLARTTLSGGSTIKNIIGQNNDVFVLIRSGAAISNITGYKNFYGIQSVDFGFLMQKDALKSYLTITDCIFSMNEVYDYAVNQDAVNCIFATYLYDITPSILQDDILDPDYLFPANIYLGYKINSPAFLAGSTAGKNIGARDVVYIKAHPLVDDFTFRNLSDIFGNKNNITPINLQENLYVNGEYQAYSDKDIIELLISWDAPENGHTRLMSDEKDALTFMYKTYWWVSISRDGGFTWTYWKVKKGNALSFESQWSKFVEQPVGNASLALIPMPETFNITDYTINTTGA